jgi:imidazolonepropionase-like amidohydrolase
MMLSIGSLAGTCSRLPRIVRRVWAPALLLTVLAPHAQAALPRVHAITHARVVVAPGQVLPDANIIIRDGLIVAVGKDAPVPADARVWPGDSLTVYAGLIDAFVMPPAPQAAGGFPGRGGPPAAAPAEPARGAANPQPSVRAEVRVVEGAAIDASQLASLRAAGFTAVQFAPRAGIVRGSSAVLNLGDGALGANVLKADNAQVIALDPAPQGYPGSLMGAISVIRQAFMDAKWYRDANAAYAKKPAAAQRPVTDNALAALQSVIANQQPALFVADEMLEAMRSVAIAREAGVTAQVVSGGDEYKRVASIAALGVPMIVPVNFPDAPDVADDEKAIEVSTEELRQWQDAPGNPAALAKAGVTFALTANGLKDTKTFADNVGKAIARGFSADAALAAVTTVPAKLLGLDAKLGTIAPGHIANLTVLRGTLFAGGKMREVWIDGERYETAKDDASPKGEWRLGSGASVGMLSIAMDKDTTVKMVANGDTLKATNVRLDDRRIRFTIAKGSRTAAYDLTARNDALTGTVVAEGHTDAVSAMPASKPDKADKADKLHGAKKDELVPSPIVMGNTEPWRMGQPAQPAAVLVKNATVWTAGPQGTLETSDVLVQGGRIAAVGKGLSAPKDAIVIDATGKHVAPGIIDEHSHSAILGNVNECTNSVTCEVRIQDVINSESPNLYRQLAGGATIMHLLHGSCNSIGGQCAVIKNKWGLPSDQLLFAEAPPTVKFALGENPKQANFGADRTDRYPKTRAGVEQTIRDAFERAQDYDRAWADYKAGTQAIPPRRDLQLDALSEIIHGKRFIHCHSYRQDEILMLMRLTEQFGFRVNTFTHILEGYKVADQMAEHGASGMGFSDWWGYKQEVIDAIPYNGYLMWDRGVNVGFNSDSDELARRLSGEAAKAIRFGGMPASEAIKTVTINPAKSLKIDQRVGSLEVGKDADFAIWSGSPLSPYSVCEQTWIEGRKYFDRAADLEGRAALAKERAALIAKARAAKNGGGEKTGNRGNFPPRYLEDTDMSGTACGDQDHADLPFLGETARKALVRGEGGSR